MNNEAAFSRIEIELPDLEEPAGIQPASIIALQPIYVAAQYEELKIFQVVDRLVELAQNGMLPLGNSSAGSMINDYWKKSGARMTPIERRNVYWRTLGAESGTASSVIPNREFNELWIRFLSAVSNFVRQLAGAKPSPFAQLEVKKPARHLAENLSLHGYGIGYFVARELQTQINEIIDILSHPDVRSFYSANSMWQLIEQVATSDLGGAGNTPRYRTMAIAGAIVIRWLAKRSSLLASAAKLRVLDVEQIRGDHRSPKPTLMPTDGDLADACEQWLAVTGIPDANMT